MTLEQFKTEVRAASPEVREEIFTLLGVLRRAGNPARARELAAKLDDPTRFVDAGLHPERIAGKLVLSGPRTVRQSEVEAILDEFP